MYKRAVFLAVSAAALGASTYGQQGNTSTKDRPVEFAELSDVLGGEVRMLPSPDAVREAAEDDERPDRPTGEIDDLLVHPQTGAINWAVISFGGLVGVGDKTVAVPASMLSWNQTEERFEFAGTEKELEQLQPFDLDEAQKVGLDQSVDVVQASWSRISESVKARAETKTKQPGMQPDETVTYGALTVRVVPDRLFAASELDDYPVFARSDEFGDIEKGIVDLTNMRLAYAVVSHGGVAGIGDELYLLPYEKLRMCTKSDEDGDPIFCVDRSKDSMKSCVRYEEPEKGVLSQERARRADKAFES